MCLISAADLWSKQKLHKFWSSLRLVSSLREHVKCLTAGCQCTASYEIDLGPLVRNLRSPGVVVIHQVI